MAKDSSNMDLSLDDHYDESLDFGGGSFATSNGSVAQGSNESLTISPRDLLMDLSAPNSNVLTNLTTPSLYEDSPEGAFETSPLFDHDDYGSSNNWPPLFDNNSDDRHLYAPAQQSFSTLAEDASAHTSSVMERTNSSGSSVDAKEANVRRMSATSGICKQRRLGRDLPPIEVVEGDSLAMKRAKNTLAARKSRQKKRDIEEGLRADLAAMTAERDRWMHTAIAHGAPLPETKVPSTPARTP